MVNSAILSDTDTICAIATAGGRGSVGIVRVSGPATLEIAKQITGTELQPRHAHFCNFLNEKNITLDNGIALLFPAPNSFTGEDVLELQGHGGNHVLQLVLDRVIALGARQARPGEFSERAFLNYKIDLVQAEAIADLIDAQSSEAARSAMRTLQGDFSAIIHRLVERLTVLRVNVEAAIDFTDEDIDVLGTTGVAKGLDEICLLLQDTLKQAQQGSILKEGLRVVIAGKPNAGKSSLLNKLAGEDKAIVTDIPGTTRDILNVHLDLGGLPLHVFDTAGLRTSNDVVEQEGVRRAQAAMLDADRILLVVDASEKDAELPVDKLLKDLGLDVDSDGISNGQVQKLTLLHNKSDLIGAAQSDPDSVQINGQEIPRFYVSALTGAGLDLLRKHLREQAGFHPGNEGVFAARKRHLAALHDAQGFMQAANQQLQDQGALELLAEDLRLAQKALARITGEFTSDDLLGEIFSSFCIGK